MKRYAIIGLAIGAAATLALRVAGQYVFQLPAAVLLLISLPVMVFVAIAVAGRSDQRALAAIALVAPGMPLDTIRSIGFARVFPNIRPVVLLTAVTYAPRRGSGSAAQSR